MSVRAIQWAFDMDGLSPTEKLVLVKLADNANDDGEAFPHQTTMARHCGMARESVNRIIKRLTDRGLLTVERGRYRNIYKLHFDKSDVTHDHSEKSPDVTEDHTRCDGGSHPDVTEDHIPIEEPSKEPSSNRHSMFDQAEMGPPVKPNGKPKPSQADFETFWGTYPHPANRGSKKVAREAFFKRCRDPTAVMRGVENYAAYLATSDWQRPAMAQTWINQQRWETWQEARCDERPGDKPRTLDLDRIERLAHRNGHGGDYRTAAGDVRTQAERPRIGTSRR